MSRLRSEVLDWFEAGRVVPGGEEPVLRAAGMYPDRAGWHAFLGHLTLWLGTIALAAAVIFFFAFNWDDLGRFAKFGLVEAAILAVLIAAWWIDLDRPAGKAVLLLLGLLTGALLALTGQIYQTGADTYELFAWWALLILPWVIAGRFSPLWLFWLALVDLAAIAYFQRGWDAQPMLWTLFGINTFALIVWEAAHRMGVSWLRDSWPPRLVAIASGMSATILVCWAITDDFRGTGPFAALAYAAWAGAFYYWYRRMRPDLFMLAGGLFSLIVTVTVFLAQNLIGDNSVGFLFTGLVVLGMSASGAIWLKSIAREEPE